MALTVRISDIQVAKAPEILVTYGLGSCIALMLYDPLEQIGGMSHYMLPDSTTMSRRRPEAYADTALVLLKTKLLHLGGSPARLRAKIAGGASMFADIFPNPALSMGNRNIEAAHTLLREHNIPLMAEDVGGIIGRSVYFDVATGKVRIRYVSREETTI
ncbi:MAG: chemotaxis protein CheD [Gemmatimonadetes bacterium]|nr:MAG: chemotaxis protein CheD [Gemmatimonadota bacterium]